MSRISAGNLTVFGASIRHIAVLAACVLFTTACNAQVVKVGKVVLMVNNRVKWVSTSGALFKLTDNKRTHVASIDSEGKLDAEVVCQPSDRFEAGTESLFDMPDPPPRLACRETMEFKFSRPVVYAHAPGNTGKADIAASPLIFSELNVRARNVGKLRASAAFNDAAIASAAKLLGDNTLEQYVVRDPLQNFKLVFSDEGIQALMDKQKSAGLKATGQLDAATQSVFLKELAAEQFGQPTMTAPVACAVTGAQLSCSSGGADTLKKVDAVRALNVPSIDLRF